ncbi:MAG: DUF3098 domain-containing protein [Bacteroidales bacterium]
MKKQKTTTSTPSHTASSNSKVDLSLGLHNYKLMLIGFAIILIGFVLMSGGKSTNPAEFTGEALYNFRRITLAPILVIFGFAFEIYAIMKKPKQASK